MDNLQNITDVASFVAFLKLTGLRWLLPLGRMIMIFGAGFVINRIIKHKLPDLLGKAKAYPEFVSFGSSILRTIVWLIVVMAFLDQIGVQTASLVAVLGTAGLSIALAFQGSLSNVASGFMLLVFQYFKVGDEIEVGGVKGLVKEIQILHTIVIKDDGSRVIIPNAAMTSGILTHRRK